jgi:hypothetical protein
MRPLTKSIMAVTAVLLASCSAAATPKATIVKPQAEPTLLLATGSGLEGVTVGGVLRYRVPGGVATTDGLTIMATEGDQLVVRDAHTGGIRQTVRVGAGLVVSTISTDGTNVALTTPTPVSYLPAGRTETPLTVVRLPVGAATAYRLVGNFVPDAFSTGMAGLFLASYLPATAPDRYQLTWLDFSDGTVTGVFGKDKESVQDMRGLAGTKSVSPDRSVLYTLYLRPPAGAGANTAGLRAQVHTLHLDQNWAHCVELPDGFGRDLSSSALTVAPDGKHVYVVDRAVRRLVEVDTTTLAITRSVDVAFTTPSGATSLVVTRDGHIYASDGTGVLALSVTTLAVDGGWQTAGPVTALAVAGDGRRLLVSSPGKVDVYDVPSGRHTSTAVPSDAIAVRHLLT